jgi:hypothetical protein
MSDFMNRRNSSNNNNTNNRNSKLGQKIQNVGSQLSNSAINLQDRVSGLYDNVKARAQEGSDKIRQQIGDRFKINTNSGVFGQLKNITTQGRQFAEANSTITKVVFLLFMVILFGILLRVGMYAITWFFTPAKNPIVINGMRTTTKKKIYQVNPNESNPMPILRSINEDQGMEFTWSTWVWMESNTYSDTTTRKRIFSKGMENSTNMELHSAPGIYASPSTNKVHVVMSKFEENSTALASDQLHNLYEEITIDNFPVKKWVNIIVRVQHHTIDVYVNGNLTERRNLDSVPKQNYGNIIVGGTTNGMDGYISSLRYFNHAIGQGKIQDIVSMGPNLKAESEEHTESFPPYLSMKWYMDKL